MYETPTANPINDGVGPDPRWGISNSNIVSESNIIVGSQVVALAVIAGIYGGVAVAFAITI